MSVLFQTDLNSILVMPTFVLCHANQSPIDTIANVENFHFNNQENNPLEISFSLRRTSNGEVNNIYATLEDFQLVYIPEWEKYYQIQVEEKDFEEDLVKNVIGKHLCEAELSQLILYDIEINTEKDILRDDHSLTVLYDPDNPKQSLLHRILNDKGLNYSIKYVSPSLNPSDKSSVRSFSINGQSIDDFLRTTLSEEYNCIVKYDSTDRSISLYDTLKICEACGHRGDYTGETCPVCGSSSIYTEYGQNTGILISTKNLAEEILVETNIDSVKTCFRVIGGDDMMTASVRAVNPNGSNYIYNFSNEMLADMSKDLRERITSYNELYAKYQPEYKELMNSIFDIEDEIEYYETSMMPTNEVNTTAQDELNKLKDSVLGEIGINSLSEKTSKRTVDNAVLGVAKLEMEKGYSVEIESSTFTYVSETASTWSGKFRVSHYSDTEDTATSASNITLTVTNDYETYVLQKIDRELARSEAYDIDTDWSLYSLDYLSSYDSAYQSCLEVLMQLGIYEEDEHGKLCKELYDEYFAEQAKIRAEMTLREKKISELNTSLSVLEKSRNEINKALDFEAYLGATLYKEFFHYRRDDEYNNSNYISDGLTNGERLRKAEELIEAASIQLYKASQTQYTISGTVANFLLMEEFQHLRDECELGNWIYIQTGAGDVYKLRLNGISGDYSSIDHLELTFSNAHKLTNPVYSLRDTILKANSIASSYSSTIHQAASGNQASQILNNMRRQGLNAAQYRIVNADNQTFTIDEHGLLGREWDEFEGTYSPEQVKLVNNLMCYTDDGWKTVKQAIGKITYKDPETKNTVNKYGVIADTIIAADIYGSKFVGGHIYSENYWDVDDEELLGTVGSHINLNDGTFTIANGFLTFDGKKLKITGDGTSLDISMNQKIKDISSDINGANGSISDLNTRITAMPGEIMTEVSGKYATQGTVSTLSSKIDQKVDSITMTVDKDGETLSGMKLGWTKVKVDGTTETKDIGTIDFTGMVSFIDLEKPNEKTVIHGGNIQTGTLTIGWSNVEDPPDFTTMEEVEEKGYQDATGVVTIAKGAITADFIKTLGLKVGEEILMGDKATISWEKVTNQPEDLAYQDDIPDDEYITTISKNTITTEYIKTLNLQVGKEISMAEDAVISWSNISDAVESQSYTTLDGVENAGYAKTDAIPTDEYIRTEITETTIATTDILAQNLQINAANITGTLTVGWANVEDPPDFTTMSDVEKKGYQTETQVSALIDAQGIWTKAIAVGGSQTDAPFRVDKYGNLVATSADIKGKITSTEGTIGGFTIDEYGLHSSTSRSSFDLTAGDYLVVRHDSGGHFTCQSNGLSMGYEGATYLSLNSSSISIMGTIELDSAAKSSLQNALELSSGGNCDCDLSDYAKAADVDEADRKLSDRIETLETANYEVQNDLIPDLQKQINALDSTYVTETELTDKEYATQDQLDYYVDTATYNDDLGTIATDIAGITDRVTALEEAGSSSGSGCDCDLSDYATIKYVDDSVAALSEEAHLRMDGIDDVLNPLKSDYEEFKYNVTSNWDFAGRISNLESEVESNADRIAEIIAVLKDNGITV